MGMEQRVMLLQTINHQNDRLITQLLIYGCIIRPVIQYHYQCVFTQGSVPLFLMPTKSLCLMTFY